MTLNDSLRSLALGALAMTLLVALLFLPTPAARDLLLRIAIILVAFLGAAAFVKTLRPALPWLLILAGTTTIAGGFLMAQQRPDLLWVACLAGLTLIALSAGHLAQHRWRGLFVNRRNRWSLSQTLAIAWTLLLLAGILSFWWMRTQQPQEDALGALLDASDLVVDPRLWQLAVLSASTVGIAGFIHHKQGREEVKDEALGPFQTSDLRWRFRQYENAFKRITDSTTDEDVDANANLLKQTQDRMEKTLRAREGAMAVKHAQKRPKLHSLEDVQNALETEDVLHRATSIEELIVRAVDDDAKRFVAMAYDRAQRSRPMGHLVRNMEVGDAHPGEMFRSETVGNAHRTDVGKVQLFLVSVVAMLTFAFGTLQRLRGEGCTDCLSQLPFLNESLFLVLTGSSLGYLGLKSVPHPLETVKKTP